MVMRMDNRFEQCIEEGKLIKIGLQSDLVKKELKSAEFDLETAQSSLSEDNHKWATVQAYYSMFHAAKALVLSKGYREKSHRCLSIALKVLFVDENILEREQFRRLRDCMNLRQDADYGFIFSEKSAEEVVGWAREFLDCAKSILASNRPIQP